MAQVTERLRDYMSKATIKHELLMELLSEFLEVEKGGRQLYDAALQRISDPEVVSKYEQFREQTIKHADLLTKAIQDFGGDAAYMSPGAKIAQRKIAVLLDTMSPSDGVTPTMVELNIIENLVLAETKDQADWELLGKIARQSTDEHLRNVLRPMVDEVEPQESDHLEWSKRRMFELAFRAVSR
ncbi:MAG: hypothetical protein ACREP6_01115 [Candidatus Binataceae bacterium]